MGLTRGQVEKSGQGRRVDGKRIVSTTTPKKFSSMLHGLDEANQNSPYELVYKRRRKVVWGEMYTSKSEVEYQGLEREGDVKRCSGQRASIPRPRFHRCPRFGGTYSLSTISSILPFTPFLPPSSYRPFSCPSLSCPLLPLCSHPFYHPRALTQSPIAPISNLVAVWTHT